MVFGIPDRFTVSVIQLDDISVIQGIHSGTMNILGVPGIGIGLILIAQGIGQIVGKALLLCRDIFFKLAVNKQVGGNTDQGNGNQYDQYKPGGKLCPEFSFQISPPPKR